MEIWLKVLINYSYASEVNLAECGNCVVRGIQSQFSAVDEEADCIIDLYLVI